jgi:hypothetical protein
MNTEHQPPEPSFYPIAERLAFLREHYAEAVWNDETKKADYIRAEIEVLERKVREGFLIEPKF